MLLRALFLILLSSHIVHADSSIKSFIPDIPEGEVIPDIAQRIQQVPLQDTRGHKMMWLGPVAFSPDETIVATGSDDLVIHLWERASGKPAGELIGHESYIMNFDFSTDGSLMASASVDSTAHIWNVAERREIARLRGHTGWVGEARFHPTESVLSTAAADGNVIVWSSPDGQRQQLWRAHQDAIWSARWSPDGRLIATGSVDRTAALWEYPAGKLVHRLEGFAGEVRMIRFSPDGSQLAVVSDNAPVRVFSVATGEELPSYQAQPSAPFTSVAYSPDAEFVVAGSFDRKIHVWQANSRVYLGAIEGHRSHIRQLDFSPSGQFFASTSGETIVLAAQQGTPPTEWTFEWAQQARMSGIWISYNKDNRVWRRDDGTFLGTASVQDNSVEPEAGLAKTTMPVEVGQQSEHIGNDVYLRIAGAIALLLGLVFLFAQREWKKNLGK